MKQKKIFFFQNFLCLLKNVDIMKSVNQTNQFFKEEQTMTKKILCLVMAVMMLAGTTVFACDTTEDLPIGYYNIVYATRYLFFATDGGSTFRPLELPRGTKVNLNDYIPTKEGYEFEGWYTTPREQVERLTEITLDENSVVWAKWKIKDGLSQEQIDRGIVAREVIGNHVVLLTAEDKTLIAPVTDLWVQQNARLEAMMKLYNQKFNKQ
jgi:uncharacterized repeat protein (TIGR02543 family)